MATPGFSLLPLSRRGFQFLQQPRTAVGAYVRNGQLDYVLTFSIWTSVLVILITFQDF